MFMVRQLFDNKKGRPVKVEDIPQGREILDDLGRFSYIDDNGRQHNFNLYQHQQDLKPFQDDYIKQKTRLKSDREKFKPPFPVYNYVDGKRFVDRERLSYELWRRWKEGCFNVYWIGGKNPIDYVVKRTWIEKLGSGWSGGMA